MLGFILVEKHAEFIAAFEQELGPSLARARERRRMRDDALRNGDDWDEEGEEEDNDAF